MKFIIDEAILEKHYAKVPSARLLAHFEEWEANGWHNCIRAAKAVLLRRAEAAALALGKAGRIK